MVPANRENVARREQSAAGGYAIARPADVTDADENVDRRSLQCPQYACERLIVAVNIANDPDCSRRD